MSPRSLALALAVLLTVSMLFVLVPTQAHPAPSAGGVSAGARDAARPAAAVAATIVNGNDVPTTTFYPGATGAGSLYFIVTDPLDHAVNVTITDPNASRDGVLSPAFHYEATLNSTTSTYNSYTGGVFYAFPASIPYAGHWNVNFSAPLGGYFTENVSLRLYYTSLSTTTGSSATLPGMPIGVFWSVHSESNGATLYTHATSVTLRGSYAGNGTVQGLFPSSGVALTPASSGSGEWTGFVPANTTPQTQLHFEVSAVTNVSGSVVENESANISLDVGTVTIHGFGITAVPPTCDLVDQYFFTTGSAIAACLQVGASWFGGFTAVAGLPITVAYWNGTAHVTPSGAPTALTSNASGEAAFTFVANSPPFITWNTAPYADALNFTVSVPGAGTHYQWTAWENATWTLTGPSSASGLVQLSLDHTNYYPGVTATATWSISSTNLTKTGAITAIGWIVTGPSAITYEQGLLNSTAATGTFTFPIIAAMAPHTIHAELIVANATTTFFGIATAVVLSPSLLLSPNSYYYDAGSTVSVTVTLNGGGTGASIQYQAWAYWSSGNALIGNGTVASGSSLSVAIPSSVPPTYVVIEAWASVGGQVVASATTEVELAQGYSIELGVSTVSSYSDGSFQPGQTITLSYRVVSVGGAALPQVMSFELVAIGYPYVQYLENVGPSGTVPFTIPSGAPQGSIILEMLARGALSAGTCFPTGACDGLVSVYVNPSPSVLGLELGAGSGITVGWLILLILVVVVAIVLFLVIRGRGGRRMKPSAAPSGAASAPPQEWKGPTSPPPSSEPPASEPATSESPPPLPPQPPAGAT
jgi:hypothetical protein